MNDRTAAAVDMQLRAFGASVFEIGVLLPARAGRREQMIRREWDYANVFYSLKWLKAKNTEGAAIYIRPGGENAFTLLDDATAPTLERLRVEGFSPTLIVQTSPSNYQAWLNHGRTLPRALATATARALAARFETDRDAADWRHLGRLAGFTNRKPKYQREDKHFPFVRLVDARPGLVYPQAEAFLATVEASLAQAATDHDRRRVYRRSTQPNTRPKTIADFHADPRYGGNLHVADLAYAAYAIGHNVPEAVIDAALRQRDLTKKGSAKRVDEYISRTIMKAVRFVQQSSSLRRSPPSREISR